MINNYLLQRKKLMASLEKEGMEKVLILDLANIYYLSGFNAAHCILFYHDNIRC